MFSERHLSRYLWIEDSYPFHLVEQECKSCLSDEFVQVYVLADSIRTWMVSDFYIIIYIITKTQVFPKF